MMLSGPYSILTPYFALDQASLPKTDFARYVGNDYSTETARKVTEGAITLLKNVRSGNNSHGLPLNKPRDLLLVGSSAAPARGGVLSNIGFDFMGSTEADFTGWNSDGYGSGGSPAPYNLDPIAAITARGRKEERPVVVDYYTYECVLFPCSFLQSRSRADLRRATATRPRARCRAG